MRLVKAIYGQTQSFPKEEMFGLTQQMRRAAVRSTICPGEFSIPNTSPSVSQVR
jgi:hypothetical protein